MIASLSNAAEKAKIVAKDGQYVSYENGIVYDEKTNLEWVAGPDKLVTWDEAKEWVEGLSLEGGGWRMPIKDELTGLYKKGVGERNMTPLLKTTGWLVWSDETEGSESAWYFTFYEGDYTWGPRGGYRGSHRAFAVRSRK